ncbi:ABC transporter ATP-binding protein [Thorsellia kenyensis]|uniref:ABC transporter ATP-binding protein n=1 Tax=Thorsellia kenyensis TaxID=1549888 RepID=A0ABV6CCB9_9GAMM
MQANRDLLSSDMKNSCDESLVTLKNVHVTCPKSDRILLNQLTLSLSKGQHWLLIGPSGGGKSTLLALIIGLIPHFISLRLSGHVKVSGKETNNLSVLDISHFVSWLNQDPFVSLALPIVEQNIALALENKALSVDEIKHKITESLSWVQMEEYQMREALKLSGGECQKIALAAILATDAELFLLDEPTSMLDTSSIDCVSELLIKLWSSQRKCSLLIEHRLDDLAAQRGFDGLPENTLVLNSKGELKFAGKTKDILIEQAKKLHLDGIWLPLESELFAYTGVKFGLKSAENLEFLAQLKSQWIIHGFWQKPIKQKKQVFAPTSFKTTKSILTLKALLTVNGLTIKSNKKNTHSAIIDRPSVHLTKSQLTKTHLSVGQRVIAEGINLSIYPRECIALLGQNGSGKSTLLMALAGLLAHQKEWTLLGEINKESLAMIFQNAEHQFIRQTVEDEVACGLFKNNKEHIDNVLRQFRLSHVAKQNPFKLSGGEKKRLSIASMTLLDRKIFLADEPTYGLDRQDTCVVMNRFMQLRDKGCAVLFTSHDFRLVTTYATRVLYLDKGKIVADCTPYEFFKEKWKEVGGGIKVPELISYLVSHFNPKEVSSILFKMEQMSYAKKIRS